MQGRESAQDNAVFFMCSLIDYIARKTKNRRSYVVKQLGQARIKHIIDLADVYHSENIDAVSDRFIDEAHIDSGTFDNIAAARYAIPSHWDIGKVYKRLVLSVAKEEELGVVEALEKVYESPICALIDDYNGSFYYGSPQSIYAAYQYGDIE